MINRKHPIFKILLFVALIFIINSRTEELFHYKDATKTEISIRSTPSLDLTMDCTISVHYKKRNSLFFKEIFSTFMNRDHRGVWKINASEFNIEESNNQGYRMKNIP